MNRAGRETFHIDRDNYEPSAELLAGIFGDISGEDMGCGMFQGYYFARPVAVEDLMEFLDGSRVPA